MSWRSRCHILEVSLELAPMKRYLSSRDLLVPGKLSAQSLHSTLQIPLHLAPNLHRWRLFSCKESNPVHTRGEGRQTPEGRKTSHVSCKHMTPEHYKLILWFVKHTHRVTHFHLLVLGCPMSELSSNRRRVPCVSACWYICSSLSEDASLSSASSFDVWPYPSRTNVPFNTQRLGFTLIYTLFLLLWVLV